MGKLRRPIGSLEKYQAIDVAHRGRIRDRVDQVIESAKAKWGDEVNCFTLHLELKAVFPGAIMWGSIDHVMTEIDGLIFDVEGFKFARMQFADPAQIKKCFNTWPNVNDF